MSFSVVRINGEPNSDKLKEFIIDSASDVSSLPVVDVADGSVAYIKDLSSVYIFKDGQWAEVG